ncbi:MAG TPA: cytochrome c family protein, partial [Hyphomicrobiales bacterium]|nr:cytochrome c family protein [Hyphomicrobiales bacterium]
MKFSAVCAGVVFCLGTFVSASFGQDLSGLLSEADPAAGEKLVRQCKACHTFESGEPNRLGPNLYGIINRPVASVEKFKYSPAMRDYGGNWDPERLDAFIENPRKTMPGTRMSFRGLS